MDHDSSPPVPPGDDLARHRVVSRSLSERGDYFLIGVGVVLGVFAAAAALDPQRLGLPILHFDLGRHPWLFVIPIFFFPLLLIAGLIATVLTPWRRSLELSWLSQLTFPFAQ